MELRTDYPYSLLRKGIVKSYPSLQQNMHCDVAVIGAGITGALMAYYLLKAGVNAALFDRRHVGMGSTAASTGMLQYEIDIPLRELIKKTGYQNATRSYLLCRQSLFDLETICNQLKTETTFIKRNSFQYASFRKDVSKLREEYKLRKAIGIPVQWMDDKDVKDRFAFNKPAGIYSKDAAEIDAYSFTHALLNHCSVKGIPVFDHTDIVTINHHKGNTELISAEGRKIKAKKVIMACGYESQKYLYKKVEQFNTTYAIVSEPLPGIKKWYKNALIWETASPYLYIRTTTDSRILIGGKDDQFSDPRMREKMLPSKAKALEKSFLKLFPSIPFQTDFKWAGVFASTKDGLPYIGKAPFHQDTYFALGYGGNGITFSVIAAQIIRDLIRGKKNKDAEIFSFNR